MSDGGSPDEGLTIPIDSLAPETLRAVVEEYVSREGTEYGRTEFSLEQKVEHVMRQLQRGEAHITFDPGRGSVDIVPTGGR
jgi:uncharacterized protein YheU (UPF0270 family)